MDYGRNDIVLERWLIRRMYSNDTILMWLKVKARIESQIWLILCMYINDTVLM